MTHKLKVRIFTTMLFLVVGGYTVYLIWGKRALLRRHKITNAYITEVNQGGTKGGSVVIKYYFYVGDQKVKGGVDTELSYAVRDSLLNRSFPVMYDSERVSANILMVSKKRWRQIALPFPDSLKWIERYY